MRLTWIERAVAGAAIVLILLVALGIVRGAPTKDQPKATLALSPAPTDISGHYLVKGLEQGGKSYHGVCTITAASEVYLVSWQIGASQQFSGVGIRQGDTLAVSWSVNSQGKAFHGVNVYRIMAGKCACGDKCACKPCVCDQPKLVGRWAALPGSGVLQSETLTFMHALEGADE